MLENVHRAYNCRCTVVHKLQHPGEPTVLSLARLVGHQEKDDEQERRSRTRKDLFSYDNCDLPVICALLHCLLHINCYYSTVHHPPKGMSELYHILPNKVHEFCLCCLHHNFKVHLCVSSPEMSS